VFGVVIALVLSRTEPKPTGPQPEDPYSANLRITDMHASEAKNFVGASVYYLEGKIANNGLKTITGATVETVFRNSLGEVVDRVDEAEHDLALRPVGGVDRLHGDPGRRRDVRDRGARVAALGEERQRRLGDAATRFLSVRLPERRRVRRHA